MSAGGGQWLKVTMPDKSKWCVSVHRIADSRAKYYMEVDGASYDESLKDTMALFEYHPDEIIDWATNNMNWEDVQEHAWRAETPPGEVDYQEGWVNGPHEIYTEEKE